MNNLLSKLTKREFEVLKLLSKAYSSKQISETLKISKRTVDTYLQLIYKKFGVQCKVGAVTLFLRYHPDQLQLFADKGICPIEAKMPYCGQAFNQQLQKYLDDKFTRKDIL